MAWVALAGALLICLGLVSLVAVHNYRAALTLMAADLPSPLLANPGPAHLDNLRSISFSSRGLPVSAWYIPSGNRAAVIVLSGTNSDRASMLAEVRLLAAAGFGALAFDWPGLGISQGSVRWGVEARDAVGAAVTWLIAQPDVDPHRIGALGFSMGGFVLTQVAATDDRVRAVVLESTPTDFNDYLNIHNAKWGILSRWPARWALRNSGLLTEHESALASIGAISPRPLFILGQQDDPEIPASMIRTLAAAAGQPKQLWIMNGANHGGYSAAAGLEYPRRLEEFFKDSLLETNR